jgi:hypothetical protein
MPADNPELAIKLIKAAIERIKFFKRELDKVNANPHSDPRERKDARDTFDAVESEFMWQWENVEMVFRSRGIIGDWE